MATTLKLGFVDYLNSLPLTKKSKDNYRQYARWFERYGFGVLDAKTIQDSAQLSRFIHNLAKNYDADKTARRKWPFNDRRKSDARTIASHYLDFLQTSDAIEKTQIQLDKAGEYSPGDSQEAKEKVLRSIALRRGQPKFRADLVHAYAGKCAVTGTAIGDVLEAAHIIPYSGVSTNHISNGLLLRSDIHALFDLRLLSVDPTNFRVYCSQQIRHEPMYDKLDGKTISMPAKSNEQPSRKALETHFEKRVS